MQDIVIDIGDNWKIIGYIDFTLTDHTEGAPHSKSDKLGKIVWYMLRKNRFEHYNISAENINIEQKLLETGRRTNYCRTAFLQ